MKAIFRPSPLAIGAAAVAISLMFGLAHADPLPKPLQKSLGMFAAREVKLENGTLRVVIDRELLTLTVYSSVVDQTCMNLWEDPRGGWGKAKIDRIEVLNASQGQGFAFTDARKTCERLGSYKGDSQKYVADHAWVCVAGMPCRPRRPGEKTSGDDE